MALMRAQGGQFVAKGLGKATVLNEHFVQAQLSPRRHCTFPESETMSETDSAFYINKNDVWRSLSQLNSRTSSGPFPVTKKLLKLLGLLLSSR